jgi:hypothetical protein
MRVVSQNFERHVFAVQHYIRLTNSRYAPLLDPKVECHPICCFGNAEKARVITVGVNPSKGEFVPANRWPNPITHTELARRCREYFIFGNPHKWFEPWVEALRHLHLDYIGGWAAHVDLSPRATRFVSDLTETWELLFLEMVERDLWTFFGTLELCPRLERILMAGSVTGNYYINEFLQRFAPDHGYRLDGPFNRSERKGNGKIAFHTLSGRGKSLDVFFCSTSPSARDKKILPRRVKEHAQQLTV